jgi:DNA-binding XRE family transcriptional regulator
MTSGSLTAHTDPIQAWRRQLQGGGGAVNRVQKFREAALMAKAELARKAGVSESTIDRVESGHDCRMETKRKILFALGLTLQESQKLFPRNGARARVAAR